MKSVKVLSFLLAASVIAAGCSKFGDTNVNPNGATDPSTAALLSGVEAGLGSYATQTREGLYSQYFSETQYTEVSNYALPRLDFDAVYSGALFDLQNIIRYNTDADKLALSAKFGSANHQIAIARILKAYIFWTITDRWGDVPYFEALKGEEELTPAYDTQEAIYKDLVKELKEASDQFDGGSIATGDLLYRGVAASWKRLANTLRMLISLRTSKVYPNPGEWAATEFANAYADSDGYISDSTQNLTLFYPGTAAYRNPWYNLYLTRADFAQSKVMTDFMAAYNDPRQTSFGSSTIGFPYGLTRFDAVTFGENNPTYSRIHPSAYRAAGAPVVVVSSAHVMLAVAEARQRGWIAGDVTEAYQKGISESWRQWGAKGDINAYVGQANVSLAGGNALSKIHMQQYFAFYPNGMQAWANWRRTGVPALVPSPNASNPSKQIPRRFTYGSLAYSVNGENTNTAVGRLSGGDTPDTKVWWDK
ncbi:SusD/RagB family nutrient-binding outer membrane lipoprotein [Terrimonas sp. NA20]|uniref:SusD/RagB family nutrient-binding outer membrane lipoprotein n=1 Tax=Terrimonas ginsenosidimutans TaxID=2908004 RepID=A0ABS9KQ05_9BACT|nr:SusD/RagB family nutrient-binding outer membrane lipoprotein [Terrimonas ginsenosidimutans]MCG2614397.1 SusD/RagB family nutrient-binding outer membrane lipoprotein [Terrimonas ginsenosidimutans]